jgi:glycosyltransferase involved in cell wall biosynthesis
LKKKKKILVAVTSDISTDQRIIKISKYLLSKNLDVIVFGRKLPDTFEISENFKIVRKKLIFNNNFLFYAEYNIRLLFYILFNKFNYIWSNDLDTLSACFIGSKIRHSDLIYDSHEYFTEVPELENRKFVRGVWSFFEKLIFPRLKNVITVNETIALEYKNKYGINVEVIRNLPSVNSTLIDEKVQFLTVNKTILYQGVLNPGRGIKPVVKALKYLKGIDLVIIGFGKVKQELVDFVEENKMNQRVHFLGRISPEKLHNYTKLADLGMVLEEPLGKSFEYCLPNKLFDFIICEIPIIASPLVEIKNVVEKNNIGLVIENYKPKHIAKIISKILDDKDLYQLFKNNEKAIKHNFYWEDEIKKIDKLFD